MPIVKGSKLTLPVSSNVVINPKHMYFEHPDDVLPVVLDLTELYGDNIPTEKQLLKIFKKNKYFEKSLQQKFEEFDRNNPQVYDMLVDMAIQVKSTGVKKLSFKLLYERVRWELLFETDSEDKIKLNNSHMVRYARMIMDREKNLKGFFDLKKVD